MYMYIQVAVVLQNADEVRRQRGLHVEREDPWENLFNFLIVLQQPIHLFIQWCISDVSVGRERRGGEGRGGERGGEFCTLHQNQHL